jgi:hypothetical protein
VPSDPTNPSPIISPSHLCRFHLVSSIIHHLTLPSKGLASIESHGTRQVRQEPASYPVQSTHSTPCITHSSTQVSNRRTNKEQKRQRKFWSSSFVRFLMIESLSCNFRPRKIRSYSSLLGFFVRIRDPGGTSCKEKKEKRATHT